LELGSGGAWGSELVGVGLGLTAARCLVGEDGAGHGDAGQADAPGALGEPDLRGHVIGREESELLDGAGCPPAGLFARLHRALEGGRRSRDTIFNDGCRRVVPAQRRVAFLPPSA